MYFLKKRNLLYRSCKWNVDPKQKFNLENFFFLWCGHFFSSPTWSLLTYHDDLIFFATSASKKLNKPNCQETSKSLRYPIPSTHGCCVLWTYTIYSNTVWPTWPESKACKSSSYYLCEKKKKKRKRKGIHWSFNFFRCQKNKNWNWIRTGRNLIFGKNISLRFFFPFFLFLILTDLL